jgi:hypothetical protein
MKAIVAVRVTAGRCAHPPERMMMTTAGQYFEDAGQHLKWLTGEITCGDCGAVLRQAAPALPRLPP